MNARNARINEARHVLSNLGLPDKQQNVRSALSLLSLLGLKPGDEWVKASNPLMGITPMMEFFKRYYNKTYAPNSRETVRRQTVHQFLQAGLVNINPDKPDRPTNSGKTVYQIRPDALAALRAYGTELWTTRLAAYHKNHPPLQALYDRERRSGKIRLVPSQGKEVRLSSGRHNELVKNVWRKFRPKFVPDGRLLYVGDTAKKLTYVDDTCTAVLRMRLDPPGKMPDMIIHDTKRDWVFLIEAVTSHGPIDPKRRIELKDLFSRVASSIVYVTAFENMSTMKKYAGDIAWETEVWIAESPHHMIHFDGERFFTPHNKD